MVAKAAKRDRKAYQAAYYRRNKKSLNARHTAARRKIQADFARGRFKAQPKPQTEVSNYGMIGGCFSVAAPINSQIGNLGAVRGPEAGTSTLAPASRRRYGWVPPRLRARPQGQASPHHAEKGPLVIAEREVTPMSNEITDEAANDAGMKYGEGAFAAELDIEVDLRQHQWDFVQACEEAGYTRASKYRDCIERASIADSTDQVSTMLNTAWQRTCGLTYELFRDRETYLTDLAFYAMACKEYQTRD